MPAMVLGQEHICFAYQESRLGGWRQLRSSQRAFPIRRHPGAAAQTAPREGVMFA